MSKKTRRATGKTRQKNLRQLSRRAGDGGPKYRESVVGPGPNTGGVGHQRVLGTGTGLNVSTEPYVGRGESEETVSLYLAVVETMYACMKNPTPTKDEDTFSFGGRMKTDKEQRDFSRYLWMLLKRSKLISIPPIMYGQLHHKWDRQMCEEVGYTWRPPQYKGKMAPENEALAIMAHTKERTSSLPFPENLPFDVVYFAYGSMGAPISEFMVATKCNPETAQRMRQVRLLGTLITDLGTCVDFFIGVDTQSANPNVPTIFNSFHRGTIAPGMGTSGGGWLGPHGEGTFDLLPFIINDLVDHVNSFVVLSTSSFPKAAKKTWRKNRKKLGVSKGEPPPPYYPYILKSSTHSEDDSDFPRPREPMSYRTDVRGHRRLLVRRGPRPMEPRGWEYFVKNGFKIYIDDSPPRDLLDRMWAKGHVSKRKEEWMAVKEVWIEPHMNNNNRELPYRPKLTIAPERKSG